MKNILEILTKFKKNAIYDAIDFTEYLLTQENLISEKSLFQSIDTYLAILRKSNPETLKNIKSIIEDKNFDGEEDRLFWQYIKEIYCEKNNENLRDFSKLLIDSKIPEGNYILYDVYVSRIDRYTEENIEKSKTYLTQSIEVRSSSAFSTVLSSNLKKSLNCKVQENYNIASILAENGHVEGLTYLGYYHSLKKNYQNTLFAIRYLTIAANNNDIDACFLLAEIYKNHPYLTHDQKIALYTIKGYKLAMAENRLLSPSYYFNDTCNINDQDRLTKYHDMYLENIKFLESKKSPYSDYIKANLEKDYGDKTKAEKIFKSIYREYRLPEAVYNLGLLEEEKANTLSPEALKYYQIAHALSYPDSCFKLKESGKHSHTDLEEIDFTILSNNLNNSDLGSKLFLESLYNENHSLDNLRALKQHTDHNPISEPSNLLSFKKELLQIYTEAKAQTLDALQVYSKQQVDDERAQKEKKEQFEFDNDLSDTEDQINTRNSINEEFSKKYHSGIYFYDKKILLKLILDNSIEFAALFNKYDLNKMLLEPELLFLIEDLTKKIEELSKKDEIFEHNIKKYFYLLLAAGYFETGDKSKAQIYLGKVNLDFIENHENNEIKNQYYLIDGKIKVLNNYKSDDRIKNNPKELRFLYNYFMQNNDDKSITLIKALISQLYNQDIRNKDIQYQHAIINNNYEGLQKIILQNNEYFFTTFLKHELDKPFIFADIKKVILNIFSKHLSTNDHEIKNRLNIILAYINIRENKLEDAKNNLEKISQNDVYQNYYNKLIKLIKYNTANKNMNFDNIPWIVVKPIEEKQNPDSLMSINIDDVLDLEDDPRALTAMHAEGINALSSSSKNKSKHHVLDQNTMLDCAFGNNESKSKNKVSQNDSDNDIQEDDEINSSVDSEEEYSSSPNLSKQKSKSIFTRINHNQESHDVLDSIFQSPSILNEERELAQKKAMQSKQHKTITSCLKRLNLYCNNQVIQSQFMFSYRLGYRKRIAANLLSNILEHSIDIPETHQDTLKLVYLFIDSLISSHSALVSGEFEITLRSIKKILDNPNNEEDYQHVDFSKLNLDQKIYTLLGDLYYSISDYFIKAYEYAIFYYRKAIDTLSEFHKEIEDVPIINKVENLVKAHNQLSANDEFTSINFDINYNAGLACSNKEFFFDFFDKANSSSKTKFEKLQELYNKYDNKNIRVLKKIKEIYESMSKELLMDSTEGNINFLNSVLENLESERTSDKTLTHNQYTYTDDSESKNFYKILDVLQEYRDTLANDGQWLFTYRAGYEKLKVCNTIYNILIDSKNTQDSIANRLKTIAYTIERVKCGEHNYLYSKRFRATLEKIEEIALNYRDSEISEKYKNETLLKDII